MNILVLSSEVPYPPSHGGVRLKMFHLLKRLSHRHEFTVFCFLESEAEREFVEAVRPYCKKIVALPAPKRRARLADYSRAPQWWMFASVEMEALIRAEVAAETFDVAHVDLGHMAIYEPCIRQVPKLMAANDSLTLLWRSRATYAGNWRDRVKYRWFAHHIERFERELYRRFDACKTNTEMDAGVIRRLCPDLPVTPVANGVDCELFVPDFGKEIANRILFTGTMDFFPNEHAAGYFAREIFPLVLHEMPDTIFEIAGRSPTPAVQRLAQPQIRVTGYVEDMRATLQQAAVYVCPVQQGTGIKNKLLEAMAAGKSIVSTSAAASGLGVSDGNPIVIRDVPGEFAAATVRLLRDAAARQELGRKARRFVEENFSWDANAGAMERLYEQAAGAKAPVAVEH